MGRKGENRARGFCCRVIQSHDNKRFQDALEKGTFSRVVSLKLYRVIDLEQKSSGKYNVSLALLWLNKEVKKFSLIVKILVLMFCFHILVGLLPTEGQQQDFYA